VVTETWGAGPDLVLLHGWGLHRGIWGRAAQLLAADFRVHLVDLPGHGEASHTRMDADLTRVAEAVARAVPPAAAWLGWSMGGLVTIEALLAGLGEVSAAVLVAANPSYVRRAHWPQGVEEAVFIDFARRLKMDFQGTLDRFLMLETLGSDADGSSLRALRAALHAGPMPDAHTLQAGLRILRDSDYSDRLAEIRQPVLCLAGGRDRLVPAAALQRAAATIPGGQFRKISGAGHAPFIGHGEVFVSEVTHFLGRGAPA